MNRILRLLMLGFGVGTLVVLSAPALRGAQATAAGYWEGAIHLPGTELAVRVELEQAANVWNGVMDIPAQGLRGFKVGDVAVSGRSVSFAMIGIPGEPRFTGALDAGATAISGTFTQNGQTFPFTLARKPKPDAAPGQTPAKGVPGTGLVGYWQGTLAPTPVIQMRLLLEVTAVPAAPPTAVLVSVDQGTARMPVTGLAENGGEVQFSVPSVSGAFKGTLNADQSEIAGTWTQGPGGLPLVFKRLASAPNFSRAQDPKPPFPYDVEEVTIQNASDRLTLAGTYTRPRGEGPFPAVVLISGSGPQDRDEAIMGHRPFLVLADHLTRAGIAVLRHDDRGVGKSTGNFAIATHNDFVTDTLSALAWLKTRKEVDAARIGLVGHSEGGLVAPIAAVREPDQIAFLVLLAGVGVPVEELLIRQAEDLQRATGADAATIARTAAAQRDLFKLLVKDVPASQLENELRELARKQAAELTEEERRAAGYSEEAMDAQIRTVMRPWFRTLLVYDPKPTLRQVKVPVLALNGSKDLQVAAKENLAGISDALAAGGNRQVTVRELPGLNHLFQTAPTGAVAEYGSIEETFNPAALKMISGWILQQTASKAAVR